MLSVLDAAGLRRWCAAGLAALETAQAEIDALNVYPVPDGDTGTNLVLTLGAVAEALAGLPDDADLAATARAVTTASLMGARGNSGVITSQLLRGVCEGLTESAAGAALARGLQRGSELADAAVATPVEGTVLTVAREAARAAAAAGEGLAEVAAAARTAADAALARTPEQLPQLGAAGVVDAGGRGWCVLLEALERVVTGRAQAPAPVVPRDGAVLVQAREAGSEEFGFEVQYLLHDTGPAAVDALRQQLGALGDSLVLVGDPDSVVNVHVHVNDVEAALQAGAAAGRPDRVTVTRFTEQVCAHQLPGSRAVVAVASGTGIGALFQRAGATVVDGGPTANPSTADVLAAVRGTGAREVVVLPNDGNVRAVAAAAADLARTQGVVVEVVPTRSVVQGLAALAVADAVRPLALDVAAMTEAAAQTRWGEVTRAVRQASTSAGLCLPGDALGLLDGTIVVVGVEVEWTARRVLELALAGGGDLVTLVLGEDAGEELGDALAACARSLRPDAEVVVYAGGQPHYPVLLGIE